MYPECMEGPGGLGTPKELSSTSTVRVHRDGKDEGTSLHEGSMSMVTQTSRKQFFMRTAVSREGQGDVGGSVGKDGDGT